MHVEEGQDFAEYALILDATDVAPAGGILIPHPHWHALAYWLFFTTADQAMLLLIHRLAVKTP